MSIVTEQALSRILNQFIDGPNFVNLFTAILNRFEDSHAMLLELLVHRFIDTAEGVWLDYIGDIVGVPRPYEPILDANIFTFKSIGEADDPDKGFGTTSSPLIGGLFQTIDGITTDTLADDETYRVYIKAKAQVTFARGTVQDIWLMVDFIFPTLTDINVTSPNIGEVKVLTTPVLQAFERKVVEKYAPVAAGIKVFAPIL
jgi:hypothetical protein